jgi:diadenosine tetraphosphatase ApaH/serine/threonine PP2A family protein phosphatase
MPTQPDTEGHRIYAVGDIHGQLGMLEAVQDDIREDLEKRPHDRPVVVYLGDYVDRGPDSRGVVENLAKIKTSEGDNRFLLGNHDQYMLNYLDEPESKQSATDLHWFSPRLGGNETLRSYGVPGVDENDPSVAHAAFRSAVPTMHVAFLETLDLWQKIGTYLFVHAGIRPGVPLDRQQENDLIWIRGDFLDSTKDHGVIVVHGHTVSDEIQNRGNRIGIDTGAGLGRELSCLVLEGNEQQQLAKGVLYPVPVSFDPWN